MFASPQTPLLHERGLLVYTQWLISLLLEDKGQRDEVKEQEKKTG